MHEDRNSEEEIEDNSDLVRAVEGENLVCEPDILSEESDDSDIIISHKQPQVLSDSDSDSSMSSKQKTVLDEVKRPHIVCGR